MKCLIGCILGWTGALLIMATQDFRDTWITVGTGSIVITIGAYYWNEGLLKGRGDPKVPKARVVKREAL